MHRIYQQSPPTCCQPRQACPSMLCNRRTVDIEPENDETKSVFFVVVRKVATANFFLTFWEIYFFTLQEESCLSCLKLLGLQPDGSLWQKY